MEKAEIPPVVAVVIPCYKVKRQILSVLAGIGPEVARIYLVDDACPEGTGDFAAAAGADPRLCILRHEANQGVGGAVMTGYRAAIRDGADIIVKIDGDGQMNPALIPQFIAPIAEGGADYVKGNRFYDLESLSRMPLMRLIGNAALSFMTKLSSGYWDLFDPTNGYTAIHARVAGLLPFAKLSKGYYFESDMLFRLNILRACVVDSPMEAVYGDEVSNLRIGRIVFHFARRHALNFLKRIFYTYYLRDFSIASLEIALGVPMMLFGGVFGVIKWLAAIETDQASTAGTVMLASLPIIVGLNLVLAAIGHDIAMTPRRAIHRQLVARSEFVRAIESRVGSSRRDAPEIHRCR